MKKTCYCKNIDTILTLNVKMRFKSTCIYQQIKSNNFSHELGIHREFITEDLTVQIVFQC